VKKGFFVDGHQPTVGEDRELVVHGRWVGPTTRCDSRSTATDARKGNSRSTTGQSSVGHSLVVRLAVSKPLGAILLLGAFAHAANLSTAY
jgi:hypothetical protein